MAFAAVLWWSLLFGFLPFFIPYLLPLFVHGDHSRFFLYWGVGAANEWTATAIVLFALHHGETSFESIGLLGPTKQGAFIVCATALLVFIGIIVVPHPQPENSVWRAMLPISTKERLAMALIMSPTFAFCEEIVFRGFTLAFLTAIMGRWPSVAMQALLFGWMHGGLHQGAMQLASRTLAGLVFAGIALWRGNLRMAMGLHFVFDAVEFGFAP